MIDIEGVARMIVSRTNKKSRKCNVLHAGLESEFDITLVVLHKIDSWRRSAKSLPAAKVHFRSLCNSQPVNNDTVAFSCCISSHLPNRSPFIHCSSNCRHTLGDLVLELLRLIRTKIADCANTLNPCR